MTTLTLELLTKEAFAPFGDVIQIDGSEWFPINNGTTKRYHNLGRVEVTGEGGLPIISMCRGDAFQLPVEVKMLERHPLGSQAFIPSSGAPFIVVVAPNGADDKPDESQLKGFIVRGDQGVNYHRGTWHHPLVTLGCEGDFIVVDRGGPGHNCDEVQLSQVYLIESAPALA
ncbi:ureidoglycolate lyase [Crenobacter luteus]|uniref:Ureidoglycolate lyase n=1 Tax=Crenobacter luteus TaxID=1452487 RepID=A0A161R8W2_9NEIS|nr:ureidoglycolate lyase [Crenobacter luteus]KZE33198.1 ureidoglycolate hydrolase [Crenobacter luteus]TCP15704.1 ureidoglycolate lyase [Crenobacter luteus]